MNDVTRQICQDDAAVEIRHLTVSFGKTRVLVDVNASLRCRGVTALVGPNGAGKSTLIGAIVGQVPYEGSISFCHHRRSGRRRHRIGLVPQKVEFDRSAPVTVLDFLCLADQRTPVWLGRGPRLVRQAIEALEWTHSTDLAYKRLGVLSGGELKRVLVAAALRHKPDILLLDEPAAGMDLHSSDLFCELLERVAQDNELSVLWVSHDLSAVVHHADHVIALNRTVLFEGPPSQVLTPERINALYGLIAIGEHPAHCVDCRTGTPHERLG